MDDVCSPQDAIELPNLEFVMVSVPHWPKPVRLGSLRADEFVAWQESKEDFAGLRLVVACWVDADGQRSGTPELLESLKKKDHRVTIALVSAAFELNGMSLDKVTVRKNA